MWRHHRQPILHGVDGATGSWRPKDTTTCADLEWPELKEVRVLGLAGHLDKTSFQIETMQPLEQHVESKPPAVVSGVSVEPHLVRKQCDFANDDCYCYQVMMTKEIIMNDAFPVSEISLNLHRLVDSLCAGFPMIAY
jgi:hypothetical protein